MNSVSLRGVSLLALFCLLSGCALNEKTASEGQAVVLVEMQANAEETGGDAVKTARLAASEDNRWLPGPGSFPDGDEIVAERAATAAGKAVKPVEPTTAPTTVPTTVPTSVELLVAGHVDREESQRAAVAASGQATLPSKLPAIAPARSPGGGDPRSVFSKRTEVNRDGKLTPADARFDNRAPQRPEGGFAPPRLAGLPSTRVSDFAIQAANVDDSFIALTYHRIGHGRSQYTVTPADFAAQMRYLHENDYYSLTLLELHRYFTEGMNLPPRSVLITVDDGYRTDFTQFHPLLQRYGLRAVYFPYSDFIDNGGVSSKMIRGMLHDGGAEFGIHTKTHAALTRPLPEESAEEYRQRIYRELQHPKARLSAITGTTPRSIAYPYGKINRQVEAWVRSLDINYGFTVNCAPNTRRTNPLRINRCTIDSLDDIELFATKLINPSLALRRIAESDKRSRPFTKRRGRAPEFLGNLSDREFFIGVPIQPFSPYFIDPDGDRMVYSAQGLPEGLSIDSNDGTVSGTPKTVSKVSGLTILATDESGAKTLSNRFDVVVY